MRHKKLPSQYSRQGSLATGRGWKQLSLGVKRDRRHYRRDTKLSSSGRLPFIDSPPCPRETFGRALYRGMASMQARAQK